MKALVTGATGFIGSHLAEQLLTMGYEVTCLVRSTSDLKWIEGLNIKFFRGDCTDKDSLKDCIKNFDYVFHLAGLTKTCRREEFYAINTRGTENLIEAVAKNCPNMNRFIYLSSLSASGPNSKTGSSPDGRASQPVSDYGKSKLKGEEAVLKYRNRIPVSIVRPAAVYGPRDKEFFMVFKFIKKRLMPYWGDGSISLLYIDDLIAFITRAAEHENAVGEIYHVSDGMAHSNNELIGEIAAALKVNVLKIKLPRSALPMIGFFGDRISKIMDKNSMLNSDKVKELVCADWTCDITKASRDLGFKPNVGLKEGIKWTAEWYRIHRWL